MVEVIGNIKSEKETEMEGDNVGLWVWVAWGVVVIAAAVFTIIFPVRREGEWNIRVGGHHDPVTGEFHGTTHHFNRSPDLTWYADCPECIAARDNCKPDADFEPGVIHDPYASVRDVPSMLQPVSGMKDDGKKGVSS